MCVCFYICEDTHLLPFLFSLVLLSWPLGSLKIFRETEYYCCDPPPPPPPPHTPTHPHTLLLTAFTLAHSTTVRADFTSYGGNGYAHNNNGTGRKKDITKKLQSSVTRGKKAERKLCLCKNIISVSMPGSSYYSQCIKSFQHKAQWQYTDCQSTERKGSHWIYRAGTSCIKLCRNCWIFHTTQATQ